MDPIAASLAVHAISQGASFLNHGLDTASTIHKQHVYLRIAQDRHNTMRAMQLDALREMRTAQLEDWEQKHVAQLRDWKNTHKLTKLTREHIRDFQREVWAQRQEKARADHQRAIELIESNERSQEHLKEFDHKLKNWPLALMPSDVVQFSKHFDGEPPLTILVAPPRFTNPPESWDFHRIELTISTRLSDLMGRFFPFSSGSQRPVHVLGGAWKENGLRQEAAIAALYSRLKGNPTLVLSSDVIGDELHLGIARWKDEVPDSSRELKLPLGNRSFEELMESLVQCHQVIAVAIADLYFLHAADLPPQLPKVMVEALTEPRGAELSHILEELVSQYRRAYEVLIDRRPAWRPELELDLAESLLALPDKSYAWGQVDASMRDWLALRGKTADADGDIYPVLLKHRKPKRDRAYFEQLDRIRRAVNVI